MLRNRIHRLLGAQHEVKLPQCSDLFGRKGLSFLEKLELPAPARLLLTEQLALLKELAMRIHEGEKALEGLVQDSPALNYVRAANRYGTNLGRRGRQRDRRHRALPLGSEALWLRRPVPSTHERRGQRLFKANCFDIATNGSAGPSSRRPGLPSVARPTSGTSTNASEPLAEKPSLAILATARLMARITWQLLTQRRAYTNVFEIQYLRSQPAERIASVAVGSAKEVQKPLKDPSDFPRRRLSPAAPK